MYSLMKVKVDKLSKVKKKKKPVFLILYLSFVILFIIALITCCITLRFVLKDYEDSMPKYVMQTVADKISGGDYSDIVNFSAGTLSPFETQQNFENAISQKLSAGEISFGKKAGEYTDTNPVYLLLAGEEQIATVKLKQQPQKSKYGFSLWELENISPVQTETTSYKITAPKGSTVTVNGVTLGQEQITQSDIAVDALVEIPEEILPEKPVLVEYTVDGLLAVPVVSATDSAGNICDITETDETSFKVGFGNNKELEEELGDFIVECAKDYSLYMSNDKGFWNISKNISSDVPLYDNLRQTPTFFYADHASTEFDNLTTSDFCVYSESCVSYDVKFDYVINMYNGTQHDFPTHLTMVMIYDNDYDTWVVGSILTHAVEDTDDNNTNSTTDDNNTNNTTDPTE